MTVDRIFVELLDSRRAGCRHEKTRNLLSALDDSVDVKVALTAKGGLAGGAAGAIRVKQWQATVDDADLPLAVMPKFVGQIVSPLEGSVPSPSPRY